MMRGSWLLSALCLCIIYSNLSGQQSNWVNWKNVDSAWQPLPRGVHVYYSADSLNSRPFRAYYVSVLLRKKLINLAVGAGKRETPDTWYRQNNPPFLVVNTSFFSIPDGRVLNLAVSDGKVIAPNVQAVPAGNKTGQYHYLSRSAIGFNKKHRPDVAWPWTDSTQTKLLAWQHKPPVGKGTCSNPTLSTLLQGQPALERPARWKVDDAVGGGPVLVQKGKIAIFNNEERLFAGAADTIRHPRTAMGYKGRRTLVVMVVEGRNPGVADGIGLPDLAALFEQLGCPEAINLDGGGSSCLLLNGRETIKPSDKAGQRTVPAVFMLWGKK